MLQLRNALAPLLAQFEKLNNSDDFVLPCPHTGQMLKVEFVVALDGAAWCMAAGARGPTCDVGKFPFTTADSREILQTESLHLPTLSDLHEVSATCEELFEGRTIEQRMTAASDTGGLIGVPLFPIRAIDFRRGSLHLLLTPTGYIHTRTCCALTAHGYLTEGPGTGGDFMRFLASEGLDVELIDTREHGPFVKVHGGNGGRELLGRHAELFITGKNDASWGGTGHPAHELCVMLAEIWSALHFVIARRRPHQQLGKVRRRAAAALQEVADAARALQGGVWQVQPLPLLIHQHRAAPLLGSARGGAHVQHDL